MGAGKRVRQRFASGGGKAQSRAAGLLDQLAEFENFKETILPAIQADIKSGMGAEEIRTKYLAVVQAAVVTTALTDPDAGKRLAASKDVIDRSEGKAKDRSENVHRFEGMSEEQIDALLKSKMAEVGDLEDETKH